MSGLGASADCPAPIIASGGVSICEPLINGSPVSVIYSVARCGTTNYSLNDTVLAFALIGGFGGSMGPMMLDGIRNLAPTGVMLLFAILYFGVMIDAGLF